MHPQARSVSLCSFDQFRHLSVSVHILYRLLYRGWSSIFKVEQEELCVFSRASSVCVWWTFTEGGWGEEIVKEERKKRKKKDREEVIAGGCRAGLRAEITYNHREKATQARDKLYSLSLIGFRKEMTSGPVFLILVWRKYCKYARHLFVTLEFYEIIKRTSWLPDMYALGHKYFLLKLSSHLQKRFLDFGPTMLH